MNDHIPADWPAPKNIRALTTLRRVWGNNKTTVKSPESTQSLMKSYHLPSNPTWLTQVHGNRAIAINPDTPGIEADACYTDRLNTICSVLTADCLPVLFCDKNGQQVAAIHAGWRGLASGIIANTLSAMESDNNEILAWLGPAISAKHYEVGSDVFEAFTQKHPAYISAFQQIKDNKWLLDLYHAARLQLQDNGVNEVYGGNHCTFEESDKFFSYRREKENRGSLASLIWIEG